MYHLILGSGEINGIRKVIISISKFHWIVIKKEMLTKTSMIFVLTFIILKSKILGSDINRYDNIDKVIAERPSLS